MGKGDLRLLQLHNCSSSIIDVVMWSSDASSASQTVGTHRHGVACRTSSCVYARESGEVRTSSLSLSSTAASRKERKRKRLNCTRRARMVPSPKRAVGKYRVDGR